MINYIWVSFIFIGVIYGLLSGNINSVNNEIIKSAKDSLELFINILPNIVLWLGIMTIAVDSGLLNKLTRFMHPLLKRLFPDIKDDNESLGYISSNIVANILGLGSAATPFGLKAMKSLQDKNPKKDTATRSMITFLSLNTSGLTLIPTTVISIRSMYNSIDPACIILSTILSTLISTISAITLDKLFYKVKK